MRRIKILKVFFIFLLFLVFIVYANYSLILTFFLATITFNIAILTMFAIGLLILYQAALRLTMLAGTFGILAYKKGKELEFYLGGISKLMPATIAHMFNRRAKKGVLYFTNTEAKDVTEWLENQFFQTKGYINFFVGTSLLLGLFGTFTGLLVAIDEMASIILSFAGDNIDIAEIMTGFSGPLGGMAIGFASSLFGVASAIILNIMQYLLSRSQASFIEDVEDWMKGKIIESQSSDVIEQIKTTSAPAQQADSFGSAPSGLVSASSAADSKVAGGMTSGFLDVFIDTMGEITERLEKSSRNSEELFSQVSGSIGDNARATQDESVLLESMLDVLRETNVNQYSNASMMEESLQEISDVLLTEHKTMKKSLQLQEDNNKLLVELVTKLNKRLDVLENKR
jgi:hypothetical protein